METERARGLQKALREYIFDALDIEAEDKERKFITVDNRSNHAGGVLSAIEIVVKIKIDE